ncbi:unnamed protein product [Cyclocybe aegerita]|uniref:Uncharacterized protein n=1 Tax=Cyclocybe aegerita TaxID=1973307 RepID=A0A8S0WIC6_CYCAE|nr:unnamed protein product [Cyclocybe aegerita]
MPIFHSFVALLPSSMSSFTGVLRSIQVILSFLTPLSIFVLSSFHTLHARFFFHILPSLNFVSNFHLVLHSCPLLLKFPPFTRHLSFLTRLLSVIQSSKTCKMSPRSAKMSYVLCNA